MPNVVWIMLDSLLSHYIAHDMSICPVCHLHIPTGTPRHGNRDRKITGNGPLPSECPYCGTEFEIIFQSEQPEKQAVFLLIYCK